MRRHPPTYLAILATAAACMGLLASPATAQSAPASQPATTSAVDADQAAAEAAADRREREEQIKQLPVVRVARLSEVVQFAIEKDDIVVRTGVPPTDIAAVVVGDRPTLISVSSQHGKGQEPVYQPGFFMLMRHEYGPHGDGVAITQINVLAPRVAISRSSEGGGEFRNVDFIQDDAFLEEGEERVRLYVQEHRGEDVVVDLKLSAINVAELRRKYPAETMRYLEPIFRDFGQPGVLFQVSPAAVWQVLGGTYEPPADIGRQVDAVLVKLDAEDARTREAAMKELEQLGQPAALVLMKRGRAGLSEEQQSRVESFLAPYKPLSDEEAARLRSDVEFLLAALSSEEPELAKRAVERLSEVAKQLIAFDAKLTGAARTDAIAKLRARLLPATTRPATTQITPRPAPPPAIDAGEQGPTQSPALPPAP